MVGMQFKTFKVAQKYWVHHHNCTRRRGEPAELICWMNELFLNNAISIAIPIFWPTA
jgi:hypothetical protein